MYTIIDIETTGGSPKTEKITEIAIYVHDGSKIVEEFSSLVNPERNIPFFITKLTGISNEMVTDAPKFYEIAKKVVELTEGRIFVAHNATFDYNFIKQEFKALGFDFNRKNICTVKLSRKLLPGHASYSLGNLCGDLGIEIDGRHRAAGDALATVKLFEILLARQAQNDMPLLSNAMLELSNLHHDFDKELLKKLPNEAGVYYFYNSEGNLIYIEKSKNIHSRVLSHFTNNTTKKAIEMRSNIVHIDFETTGNELVALLKESEEIKEHKPIYNRAQRRSRFNYGLYAFRDKAGYINLKIEQNTATEAIPLTSFSSSKEAKENLNKLIEEFQLCQKLCHMYKTDNSCFHYQIGQCLGACVHHELPESYNKRVQKAISKYEYEDENVLIIDKGRHNGERSIVQIKGGKYIGYGYLDLEQGYISSEQMMECIKSYRDNREIQMIIKRYLRTNSVEKILPY